MSEIYIDWWPQPRQLACLSACGLDEPFSGEPLRPSVADIIGYGGSAGGGKTDTLLEIGQIAALKYQKLNIGYFRREFPQLEGAGGAILRSQELFSNTGKYNEQKHRWTFHGTKSLLQFCHCKDPNDVYNYQSQQFDILLIDEVTQFTRDMVKYLLGRNRATVDYPTFKPFAAFATNPGNVGHGYFKDEFVTIGEPEKVHIYINEVGKPEKHIFIPSKLEDNQILVSRDPGYADRVGNTEMNRKILLEGSWDVYAGQAFSELNRNVHIIPDIHIENRWKKFGAYDHGFNHPFSFGVYVIDDDGYVYRVAAAKSRLKRVDEIARIMDDTASVVGGVAGLDYIVAGLDCWSRQRDGGPTIYEQFLQTTPRIELRQAQTDRVQGVNQIRQFLAYKGTQDGEDGKPRFFFCQSASKAYDTVAGMIFDTDGPRPEDVLKVDANENGEGGDDEYDEIRYALMSRPKPLPLEQRKPRANSVMAYIQKKEEERWRREEYGY